MLELAALGLELCFALVELGLLGGQLGSGLVERSAGFGLSPRCIELGLALLQLRDACASCARPPSVCCSWAARAACVANGSTTCPTPAMSDAMPMRALIAAFCASVKAPLPSARKTTVPLPPDAAGNSVASRWVTCAVGVPGIDRPSARCPPPMAKATPATARIATQAMITVRLRWLAKPPIR